MIQRIQSASPTAHHFPKNNKKHSIEIEESAQSVNISKSGRASAEEHPHVHGCDKTIGFGCKTVVNLLQSFNLNPVRRYWLNNGTVALWL